MRIKKYFFPLLFIVFTVLLLNSCNLSVVKPDLNSTPAFSSEIPVIPTNTVMPVSSPTPTLTFTPQVTLTPSATTTLFMAATATATQQWSSCPGIVVTVTDTDAGDVLHILRCEDGLEYDLGPLAKGVYAVGPNDKFLIYVSLSGFVYGARIGEPFVNVLFNLLTEREFSVLNKKVLPNFKISFVGEAPNYGLVLLERNYDQKRMYELPSRITH
jgi:hypothetical protein